jgi:hypothetical protein
MAHRWVGLVELVQLLWSGVLVEGLLAAGLEAAEDVGLRLARVSEWETPQG